MGEPVGNGASGSSEVDHRDITFKLVVTRFVEDVAQAYYARGFSDEIESEAGRGASEDANDWIQFAATALQVGARDGEVGPIQRGGAHKKKLVLPVPEFVFSGGRLRNGHESRGVLDRGRIHSSFGNQALCEQGGASHEGEEKSYDSRIEYIRKLAPSQHKVPTGFGQQFENGNSASNKTDLGIATTCSGFEA
ncbi:MAG TPA: hypothetical protein VMG82_03020 [Candidatus Sulfotelmatobacter sp.]|nr:hypothetical protein [Candidatus Sulfotelmatobacter sp.]